MTFFYCALVWAACACAAAPSFEVATIKPADPNALPTLRSGDLPEAMRFQQSGDQIDYRGVSLFMLLQRAYGLNPAQISGPDWIQDARYDIVAKFPAGATKDDVPAMLKQLLTERFHLVLHLDQKTLKIYEVSVAKGGPKLSAAKPLRKFDNRRDQEDYAKNILLETELRMRARVAAGEAPGQSRGVRGATVSSFLKTMSFAFDRPLKDSTGITGTYGPARQRRNGVSCYRECVPHSRRELAHPRQISHNKQTRFIDQ